MGTEDTGEAMATRLRPQYEDRTTSDGMPGTKQEARPATRSPRAARSQIKRPSRPRHISTTTTAGFVSHTTPPPTPGSPPADYEPFPVSQSLFQNYLRALYVFDPATSAMPDEDASLSTVRIKPGDLILIHVVHANGWADGTVLNTGDRGWLPTNYCEAYDHPYLRNLLHAMTQFWDLLGASENASLSTFVRQDYIRGLIAGVRYLLERADCLHREAPTVKQHAGIRRMRKGLLADLSSLVGIAKRLQETISESFAAEVVHVLLDDLISKAFKVVTRAVSFYDVWSQETSCSMHLRRQSLQRPTTGFQGGPPTIDTQSVGGKNTVSAVDSAVHLPQQDGKQDVKVGARHHRSEGRDKISLRRSAVFTPPDGMVAHRLSLVTKDRVRSREGSLASEQLAKVHDVCISYIAAFIGLHLHSRPSAELVTTTERLVKACRDMLAIVEEVSAHDPPRSTPVQQVKEEFEAKLEDLANSTRDVFRFSDSPDEDVVMLHDQHQHLINVGTSLIRNAGDCVVKTRLLIEQIGDFELKSSGHSTASTTSADVPARIDNMTLNEAQRSHRRSKMRSSLDAKMLPPPPPVPREDYTMVTSDVPLPSSIETLDSTAFPMPPTGESQKSLPPIPSTHRQRSSQASSMYSSVPGLETSKGQPSVQSEAQTLARKDSVGMSIAGSTETFCSSMRDSGATAVSQASTRATTPENAKDSVAPDGAMLRSFASISSMPSLVTEDSMDVESQLLQKSYILELTRNKEGQITGGSLQALVEQLTAHDLTPDPQFVAAFFLTFRKFAEPRELAQALIHRFEYVGDSRTTGTPARLRIYNFFKGWLETYWHAEADKDALGEIRFFALHKLKPVLPQAGDRLTELTRRVSEGYAQGTLNGPLVSAVGKSSMSFGIDNEKDIPTPNITNKQLNALRLATGGGVQCSILDIDAIEMARQITIMMMTTYCEIRPEELLSMDWGNSNTTTAKHIRKMCLLNTDLANFVADSILGPDDAKKRANVIKHWAKIGLALLELNNYDSIMSIVCSINSCVVQRLKRTWELVSKKTRARLEELNQVIDISKNYTKLRRRLDAPTSSCLPFLGIYLTDLTFVVAGNSKRREIPGSANERGEAVSVINFDLYMRMAKLVSHMQRFQAPYRLQAVPELQSWLELQLRRMRDGTDAMTNKFHRRSTMVEPKDVDRRHVPAPEIHEDRSKLVVSAYSDLGRWYNLKSATFSIRTLPGVHESADQRKRAGGN